MATDLKALATAARALPPDQQAELIDELIVNLGRARADWNAAWSGEADARWAKHVASGKDGHAADEVLADIGKVLAARRSPRLVCDLSGAQV
jgi:Putative addiction module component